MCSVNVKMHFKSITLCIPNFMMYYVVFLNNLYDLSSSNDLPMSKCTLIYDPNHKMYKKFIWHLTLHFMLQRFEGNDNTYSAELREVSPPIIGKRVRFIPYCRTPRTVCLRVEMYGCPWTGTIIMLIFFRLPKTFCLQCLLWKLEK